MGYHLLLVRDLLRDLLLVRDLLHDSVVIRRGRSHFKLTWSVTVTASLAALASKSPVRRPGLVWPRQTVTLTRAQH
jgi:hypothetical protein